MQTQVESLVEKLNHMSPDRLAEINDFIDFIRLKDMNKELYNDFTQASEVSFSKVWDNDEDSVYDTI